MTITYPDFQRKRGTTKEFYLLLVLDFNLVLITEPHLHITYSLASVIHISNFI